MFSLSEEIFLLGQPSHLYRAHKVLSINHSLPFIRPRIIHTLGQGPRPYIQIWALTPTLPLVE